MLKYGYAQYTRNLSKKCMAKKESDASKKDKILKESRNGKIKNRSKIYPQSTVILVNFEKLWAKFIIWFKAGG